MARVREADDWPRDLDAARTVEDEVGRALADHSGLSHLADYTHEMDELEIHLEAPNADSAALVRALENQVHVDMGFRPRVKIEPAGALPRFELKARRVFDRRTAP